MSAELERAEARALLARLVAALLTDPDPDVLARLNDPACREAWLHASDQLALPGGQLPGLLDSVPPLDEWRERFNLLFGHAVRGECPPYELEYNRGFVFQQADTLADVSAFYNAFGLAIGDDCHERPDHIGAEWEFLALCAARETYARRLAADSAAPHGFDAASAVATCRDAQRSFLRDHAAGWMPAFFGRVGRSEGAGAFLVRCAEFAERVLQSFCHEFGVPFGPAWLELRAPEEDDLHMECGAAAEPGANVEVGAGLAGALARERGA